VSLSRKNFKNTVHQSHTHTHTHTTLQNKKRNWCSADSVQLSYVRETAKRYIFSRRLKVPSVCDAVTLDGKLFQMRGAATKKARSPIVEHDDLEITCLGMIMDSKGQRSEITGVEKRWASVNVAGETV